MSAYQQRIAGEQFLPAAVFPYFRLAVFAANEAVGIFNEFVEAVEAIYPFAETAQTPRTFGMQSRNEIQTVHNRKYRYAGDNHRYQQLYECRCPQFTLHAPLFFYIAEPARRI